MQTLNGIISDLSQIAADKQYEGPTVDALIYLMANGIYKNNLNAVNAVLEASKKRCKLLNSAIQHAQDAGYSVNRGTNQHIHIENYTTVLVNKPYKKYEQAKKMDGKTLYYAHDGFINGDPIDLIVGMELIDERIDARNVDTLLSLRSVSSNISQDVSLFLGDVELTYTEVRHKLLEHLYTTDDMGYIYWLLTTTDYGIEFYKYLNNPIGSTDPSADLQRFMTQDVYTIKGIAYSEEQFDDPTTQIKTFPGIKIGESTRITYEPLVPRENDIPTIYANMIKAQNSDFMLRTTEDMQRAILAIDQTNLTSCYVKYYATYGAYQQDFNENPDVNNFPATYVFYLTSTINPSTGVPDVITENAKQTISDNLLQCYYVDNHLEFKTGIKKTLPSDGGVSNYKLKIDIEYTSLLDPNIAQYITDKYSRKLGQRWNPDRIVTDITKRYSGISTAKVDLSATTPTGSQYDAKPWEYLEIDVEIYTTAATDLS